MYVHTTQDMYVCNMYVCYSKYTMRLHAYMIPCYVQAAIQLSKAIHTYVSRNNEIQVVSGSIHVRTYVYIPYVFYWLIATATINLR